MFNCKYLLGVLAEDKRGDIRLGELLRARNLLPTGEVR